MKSAKTLSLIPSFDKDKNVQVVIETPKGSRNKYAYEEAFQTFSLKSVLTVGAVFPFDFGFIPDTRGDDGDPIDVLVLMDEPTYPGVIVPARLIGVIEAEQTEKGKSERNDRLFAVSIHSQTHASIQDARQADKGLIDQLEHFFVSYNEARGKEFKVLGYHGPARAVKLVERGQKNLKKPKSPKK